MFSLAVRHSAAAVNPVRETGRLPQPHRPVAVLADEDVLAVRAAIGRWQQSIAGRPGPRHTGDLAEIMDFMLATGARIGEILALRWADLALGSENATLTICGTIVFVKGTGFLRQDWPKSHASYRTIVLPGFAVEMLLDRRAHAPGNSHDAVFASRRGTWLSPHNVRRQWRQARGDAELSWVTPHSFRKTVATVIEEHVDIRSAAAQLGHSRESVTARCYIAKPALAPDVSAVLERLGRGGRALEDPAGVKPTAELVARTGRISASDTPNP
jgi:integrase